jgi:glycosidase
VTSVDRSGSSAFAPSLVERILDHLAFLYGAGRATALWHALEATLVEFRRRQAGPPPARPLTEGDAILITYGDQFREAGQPPLQTLHSVLSETLDGAVSGVHILPFFPYSSDDGFSIIDYTAVDPDLGTWDDVERIAGDFRLMVDAVVNHVSRHSPWFQRFVQGDPVFAEWFIAFEPDAPTDWIRDVVRPRALPLLTPFETEDGPKRVWTTFSDDQIDLNYAHPAVLLAVIEVLLLYVEKGAQVIRLDAIAYLWKKTGTPCIHLEETHHVIKLLRCVLDAVAPGVLLITETNVPHEENVSYFGDPLPAEPMGDAAIAGRTDEAQLVYQFPLAPLIMNSLITGSARVLSQWAAGLEPPAPRATFFNFTASHDGIGVMPARGLLTAAEIQALVDSTLAHGGRVSFKTNPDGSQSVYELNISYFDALSDPAADEPLVTQVRRFVVSQAIMLALAGLPGIYVHSLLGSRSWPEGVARTGHNRTINRQRLDRDALEKALVDPASLRSQVLDAYRRLLRARAADPAFHPYGGQRVLPAGEGLSEGVFALLRTSPGGDSQVLCLHNVSDRAQPVEIRPEHLFPGTGPLRDLIGGEMYTPSSTLRPYAVAWLKAS